MFRNGNDLALKADCNRVMGSYQAQGDTLSLTLGASTKAMCPPDTLDDRFLAELQETTGFRRDDDTLVLFLGQNSQMMEFIRDAQ